MAAVVAIFAGEDLGHGTEQPEDEGGQPRLIHHCRAPGQRPHWSSKAEAAGQNNDDDYDHEWSHYLLQCCSSSHPSMRCPGPGQIFELTESHRAIPVLYLRPVGTLLLVTLLDGLDSGWDDAS